MLVGNFILAEAVEVTSATWWAAHQNVGCIVQCTSKSEVFVLPQNAATSQRFYVDPCNEADRQAMLDRCIGQVEKTLVAGHDVLWHCRQSFHRGPVTAAAGYARLTGLSPQAHALIKCIEITTMALRFSVVLVLSVLQYSCQREIACTVDYIFKFVYCSVFNFRFDVIRPSSTTSPYTAPSGLATFRKLAIGPGRGTQTSHRRMLGRRQTWTRCGDKPAKARSPRCPRSGG